MIKIGVNAESSSHGGATVRCSTLVFPSGLQLIWRQKSWSKHGGWKDN